MLYSIPLSLVGHFWLHIHTHARTHWHTHTHTHTQIQSHTQTPQREIWRGECTSARQSPCAWRAARSSQETLRRSTIGACCRSIGCAGGQYSNFVGGVGAGGRRLRCDGDCERQCDLTAAAVARNLFCLVWVAGWLAGCIFSASSRVCCLATTDYRWYRSGAQPTVWTPLR